MRNSRGMSPWFDEPPQQSRARKPFLTSSQRSVLDADSESDVGMPPAFRGTFKRILPSSRQSPTSPRSVIHRRSPTRRFQSPQTTFSHAPSPQLSPYQDRPTAVSNKYPFVRPSQQMHSQSGQASPRLAHGQRPKGSTTLNADPRQPYRPVLVSTRSPPTSNEYYYGNMQNQHVTVVDNRTPRTMVVSEAEPLVRYY